MAACIKVPLGMELGIGPGDFVLDGGSEHPSNTWFPGPTRVLNPNGILIGAAIFAGLTSVTDRQTDRPTDRQTMLLGRQQ